MTVKPAFKKNANYYGVLREDSYKDIWSGKDPIPESPMQPIDCWLVCKPLEEKCSIPGFIIRSTPEFDKDREIDCVVLASGPGYRVRNGVYPYHCDGRLMPNEVKRGDIVHFLERAGHPFTIQDEQYYLLEEHKVYFAIDP